MIKPELSSGRPEAAFVLLLLQSIFWVVAGLSAAPFVLGGEVFMALLSATTLLLALGTCLIAIGVLWRRRGARRLAIALEVVCLVGTFLLLVIPIGANHGPVSLLVNAVLPVAVIVLLREPWGAML